MAFPFKDVLGYQLQVFGVQICIPLHCARAPSLFVAVSSTLHTVDAPAVRTAAKTVLS